MADDNLEFSLPQQVSDIELVPDDFRNFYRKSNQGAHYVRIDPSKLTETQGETTKRLQNLMAQNERLTQQLSEFKDINLDQYKEVMAKKEEIMAAEAASSGEIESIRRQIQASEAAKTKEANARAERAERMAQTVFMQSEFEKAFEQAHVVDDDTPRRMLRNDLSSNIAVEMTDKGVAYSIRGEDGPLLNDEGKPMRLIDLVNSRREACPWAFAGSKGSGGGSPYEAPSSPLSMSSLEGKTIAQMNGQERKLLYEKLGPTGYNKRLRNEADQLAMARKRA